MTPVPVLDECRIAQYGARDRPSRRVGAVHGELRTVASRAGQGQHAVDRQAHSSKASANDRAWNCLQDHLVLLGVDLVRLGLALARVGLKACCLGLAATALLLGLLLLAL